MWACQAPVAASDKTLRHCKPMQQQLPRTVRVSKNSFSVSGTVSTHWTHEGRRQGATLRTGEPAALRLGCGLKPHMLQTLESAGKSKTKRGYASSAANLRDGGVGCRQQLVELHAGRQALALPRNLQAVALGAERKARVGHCGRGGRAGEGSGWVASCTRILLGGIELRGRLPASSQLKAGLTARPSIVPVPYSKAKPASTCRPPHLSGWRPGPACPGRCRRTCARS